MKRPRGRLFWAVFVAATLIIAGGFSYLASPSPDGLDSATLRGCEVIELGGAEELTGQCIAQSATGHPMAGSPLADYSIAGADGAGGVAGVIGVLVTLAVAGGVFWVIARGRSRGMNPGPGG
jgi:cobalt/nickel transport protein